jgi:hypothetical protein
MGCAQVRRQYYGLRMTPGFRKPILWRLMLTSAAAVVLLGWFGLRNREPAYAGKRLTDWLYEKDPNAVWMANDVYGHVHNELWDAVVAGGYAARGQKTSSPFWTQPSAPAEPAVVATRQIGTKAIPRLLELMSSGPGLFERVQDRASEKLPTVGNFLSRHQMFQTAEGRRIAAWKGFGALGTNAEPALPVLGNMLQQAGANLLLGCTIASIGPKGEEVLLSALTNADDNTIDVAAFCLGLCPASRTSAVPALVSAVDRGQATYHVLGALGRLGCYPELVVPAVSKCLTKTNALPPASVGQAMAILILGLYGEQSRPAVPILVKLYEDPDTTSRQVIRVVLKHIDPEHVEQLLGRAPDARDDQDPWWGGAVN